MTAIDTQRDSLTIVKTFLYRGAQEEFSNTYFMSGTTPTTAASWKVLADAVIAQEKLLHTSLVTIIRAVGHVAGDSVQVWEHDYAADSTTVPGTRTQGTDNKMPGDSAVWVRWTTGAKTVKGKPIYLRNYYHPAWAVSGNSDNVPAALKTALETYATAWVSGFTDGDGHTHSRCGPHGVNGVLPVLGSSFVTTRTLERRGKRP